MALPDYPHLKLDISRMLNTILKDAESRRMKPFDEGPRLVIHEGGDRDFSTVDGQIKQLEMETFEVELNLSLSSLADMTHEDVVSAMLEIGNEFGEKVTRRLFKNLGRELEEVGQVQNLEGREMSSSDFFEMLDNLFIAFDNQGNPHLPQIYVAPNSPVLQQMKNIESEPGFQEGFAEMIEKKRGEWHAGESNRKLVD